MYPFHNNSGLMNWQYYQNGHIPYSHPFQAMGNQSYDMTSIMQYNAWQSQMNRYSPLDSFTTHTTKVLADAINQGAELHNQVSTDVNIWCDTNKSLESTTISPETQITNCEVTSPNEVCSDESPWHSTVKITLPAISPSVTQINDPIQLSPISGEKTLHVSPDNITSDEWIDWAKCKLAYTDKDEVSEWSSNLDICLPDLNEREPTTETLEHTTENNTIFDDTNIDILNFNQNESVKINDDCKEMSEELLIEENIESNHLKNSKESEILLSVNNTIEKINTEINCSDNSKLKEISSSENTSTENMKAGSNGLNNSKESEILPSENNAIENINEEMDHSNFTKEIEISPSENTSIEKMDVESDRSDTLNFNQNESAKINDDCKEMSEELLIDENIQIDHSNNSKESEMLQSEKNTLENIYAKCNFTNNLKVLEIADSENNTTEYMNAESNSSNKSKDSEILSSENYATEKINDKINSSNITKELEIPPSENTLIENMDVESNGSSNLKEFVKSPFKSSTIENTNSQINVFNITKDLEISLSENTAFKNMDVESNGSCNLKNNILSISENTATENKNIDSDGVNISKELKVSLTKNTANEIRNEEHQCFKLLEESSMDINPQVGCTIKSENSMDNVFGGHDSHRIVTLRLHLKKTCTGIWVVKNRLNQNIIENNDYENIEMYGNEQINERYIKCELPSQIVECKLEDGKSKEWDIKSFECKKCSKVFNLKTSLNNHMLTHSNIKPFICSFCGKAFKLKNTLNIHILGQHTNERPFKCNLCSKGFYQKGALKSHSITHTGEKPYRCEICEKGFTQSGSLKIHMRTHSEKKQLFDCPFCNKNFILKRTMIAHMKSHNMENEI